MICNYCSQENPENSVFCKNCGKRIDGKKVCSRCKALIDDNALYCNMCGARTDGKNACEECGNVYEGNFCPSCGTTHGAVKQPMTNGSSRGWQNILHIVGLSIGLAGAAFAFIFMFFMGISLSIGNAGALPSTFKDISMTEGFNLFDCFGKNFDFVNELDSMSEYTNVVPIVYYFYAVTHLIIAVATIVCTTTFLILAIYRFVNTMRGRKSKSAEIMIFAAIFSFIAGALCFRSLNYLHINTVVSSDSASISVGLNGATLAGVIITLILAAVMFGLKIAAIAPSLRKTALFKTLTSGGCAIFALILFLLLTGQITLAGGTSSTTIKLTTGFIMLLSGVVGNYSTYSKYYTNQSTADTALFIGIAGHMVTIILIIILAIYIVYTATKTIDDKEKSSVMGIVFSGILFICAIMFMIFSIIGKNLTTDIMGISNAVFRLNALPYIGIIVTALLLAAEITYAALKSRFKTPQNNYTESVEIPQG